MNTESIKRLAFYKEKNEQKIEYLKSIYKWLVSSLLELSSKTKARKEGEKLYYLLFIESSKNANIYVLNVCCP